MHPHDTPIFEPATLTAALRAKPRGWASPWPALAGDNAGGIDRFHEWLAAGYAGEMSYLPSGPTPTVTRPACSSALAACSSWP